jgi:beta-lactam-binding protein with PASTA domain
MGLKSYFKGRSGMMFWINVLLMFILLVGFPVLGLQFLGSYTHHGEKVEVIDVVGQNVYEAEIALSSLGLETVVADSTYQRNMPAGVIIRQVPKAGNEIKSGRIVYLTKNLDHEPLVVLPDLVGNCSRREAEAQLRSLGFRLTEDEEVEDEPKGLVVGIKQNGRRLTAEQRISKGLPLTLCVGAGYDDDTIYVDNSVALDSIVDIDADF